MKALFPGGRCLEFRGWSWGGGLLLFFLALFLPGAALKAAPLEVSPYSSWPGGTVQTLKLSSGVQATIQRVPSAWAAAVNLSLEAGSQYDPPGQWGTAHLVEHLLFRRTPAFPAGKLGLSLEKIGAQSGASTTPQKMEFWEIVPAQSLDLALEISASRLSGLLLGKGDLERERQQVAAELRRLHTNPWRLLQSHFLGALYPQATPSKLHPEGSWEEMRSLTPSQLLDFYQRYCQPQRARLVVVTAEPFNLMAAKLERLFGAGLLAKREAWAQKGAAHLPPAPPAAPAQAEADYPLDPQGRAREILERAQGGLSGIAWATPALTPQSYARYLLLSTLWWGEERGYFWSLLQDQAPLWGDDLPGDGIFSLTWTPQGERPLLASALLEMGLDPKGREFLRANLAWAKRVALHKFYHRWGDYPQRLHLIQQLSAGDPSGEGIAQLPQLISCLGEEELWREWLELFSRAEVKAWDGPLAQVAIPWPTVPGPGIAYADPDPQLQILNNGLRLGLWPRSELPQVEMEGFIEWPGYLPSAAKAQESLEGLAGLKRLKSELAQMGVGFKVEAQREGISFQAHALPQHTLEVVEKIATFWGTAPPLKAVEGNIPLRSGAWGLVSQALAQILAAPLKYSEQPWEASTCTWALVGPLPSGGELAPLLERAWPSKGLNLELKPLPLVAAQKREVAAPPGPWSVILAAQRTPSMAHPDFQALELALQILGGSHSSRLAIAALYKERLATLATVSLGAGRDQGRWAALLQTPAARRDRAIQLVRRELAALAQAPPEAGELRRAVVACQGKKAVLWSQPQRQVHWLLEAQRQGLKEFHPQSYLGAYGRVQAQAVQRAARQWMAAQGLAIVYSQPQAKEKADGREG